MDHEDQEHFGAGDPLQPDLGPSVESDVSATYLPYGDDRLWVGMPAEDQGAKRSVRSELTKARRLRRKKASGTTSGAAVPAMRAKVARLRVKLPRPKIDRRVGSALVAAIVIVPASAFALMSSGGGQEVTAIATTSPSPEQQFLVVDIEGFRADRVNSERVVLVWDEPIAVPGEEFVYTVYRDGKLLAEDVSERKFVDDRIRPKTYYYYAITATGTAGSTATSLQLLVAVPSETGQLPTEPPPAPPPPPPAPIPSPSPSPTTRPSSSPKPSASGTLSFSLPPPPSTTSASPPPSPSPSPSPTDTVSPSPTDTVSPSPTDTVPPSPTDTLSPSPTDTVPPSPTDTVSPSPIV